MTREIKFRAWSEHHRHYSYSDKNGLPAFFEAIKQHDAVRRASAILQQFTGLHDKNGKEIYEGDIVECGDWEEDAYGWNTWRNEVKFEDGAFNGLYPNEKGVMKCEVIGNIYENSDLLKQPL